MANLNKKILIVIGHPKSQSFCHALAESFAQGVKVLGVALPAGVDVELEHLPPEV